MNADVKIIEGGQSIRTENMLLTPVRDFSGDITLYENKAGQAVVYFGAKDEYVLISIDMA